jgi:hypothetical protein
MTTKAKIKTVSGASRTRVATTSPAIKDAAKRAAAAGAVVVKATSVTPRRPTRVTPAPAPKGTVAATAPAGLTIADMESAIAKALAAAPKCSDAKAVAVETKRPANPIADALGELEAQLNNLRQNFGELVQHIEPVLGVYPSSESALEGGDTGDTSQVLGNIRRLTDEVRSITAWIRTTNSRVEL